MLAAIAHVSYRLENGNVFVWNVSVALSISFGNVWASQKKRNSRSWGCFLDIWKPAFIQEALLDLSLTILSAQSVDKHTPVFCHLDESYLEVCGAVYYP